MLVLTRRLGEKLQIGDDVTITVAQIAGGNVRVGIEAPAEKTIVRGELSASLATRVTTDTAK
ncbi:MAG TPA: carbon storage regulator [Pirellulales bacterium]|jgi:carbon storage regulator|nr:carbon storage regulator [Pirellulales bacterium]